MGKLKYADYYGVIKTIQDSDPTKNAYDIALYLKENYSAFKNKEIDAIRRNIDRLFNGTRGKYLQYAEKKEAERTITNDKKKIEDVPLWEIIDEAKSRQNLKRKLSSSQEHLTWKIETDEPICVMVLGDTQLGSFGTDYDLFKRLTEEVLNTPNLYVLIVGDIIQLAIKMRSVAEVLDNMFDVGTQYYILEKWLDMIKHKVIAATWSNHESMREENVLGYSPSAKIFGEKVPYFTGIGEIDMIVGDETYKVAASHFFMGRSMYNKAHAPMRYMREKANHIEIAVQGDFHQPGILQQEYGGLWRLSMVCGSIQTNSSYAKRFFSLKTVPNMPCFTLSPHEHYFNAYATVGHYLMR